MCVCFSGSDSISYWCACYSFQFEFLLIFDCCFCFHFQLLSYRLIAFFFQNVFCFIFFLICIFLSFTQYISRKNSIVLAYAIYPFIVAFFSCNLTLFLQSTQSQHQQQQVTHTGFGANPSEKMTSDKHVLYFSHHWSLAGDQFAGFNRCPLFRFNELLLYIYILRNVFDWI